jgi:hypothetical protein
LGASQLHHAAYPVMVPWLATRSVVYSKPFASMR